MKIGYWRDFGFKVVMEGDEHHAPICNNDPWDYLGVPYLNYDEIHLRHLVEAAEGIQANKTAYRLAEETEFPVEYWDIWYGILCNHPDVEYGSSPSGAFVHDSADFDQFVSDLERYYRLMWGKEEK